MHIYDEGEAKAIVRLLLEVRFKMSYTDILCNKVTQLSVEDIGILKKMMQRLEQGEPIQYVLGQADFYGRTFHVAPGVLIPRPETEELCAWITQDMDDNTSAFSSLPSSTDTAERSDSDGKTSILDIGTGSGCIAITLALNLPKVQVAAWDLSVAALKIAEDNARRLHAKVDFSRQDALKASEDHDRWHIIVSNPPYICRKESGEMNPNVLEHEPDMALFVPDDNPLLFYQAIATYAGKALEPDGSLYFEINPTYVEEMKTMLTEAGLHDITVRQDQFGKPRMMRARKQTPRMEEPMRREHTF